jgi:hypothetical protein
LGIDMVLADEVTAAGSTGTHWLLADQLTATESLGEAPCFIKRV